MPVRISSAVEMAPISPARDAERWSHLREKTISNIDSRSLLSYIKVLFFCKFAVHFLELETTISPAADSLAFISHVAVMSFR